MQVSCDYKYTGIHHKYIDRSIHNQCSRRWMLYFLYKLTGLFPPVCKLNNCTQRPEKLCKHFTAISSVVKNVDITKTIYQPYTYVSEVVGFCMSEIIDQAEGHVEFTIATPDKFICESHYTYRELIQEVEFRY